jgi:hypothetical protein
MGFDCRLAADGLVFGDVDDTVNTEAETLRELRPVTRSVSNGVLNENFVHSTVIHSGWTFRPGEDASARQRILDGRDADGP